MTDPGQQPPAMPQYSADGLWWWTGNDWIPANSRPTTGTGVTPEPSPSTGFTFITPSARRRFRPSRRMTVVAAGTVALVGIGGVVCVAHGSTTSNSKHAAAVGATTAPNTYDLTGTLEVAGGDTSELLDATIGSACDSAGGGYSDIAVG